MPRGSCSAAASSAPTTTTTENAIAAISLGQQQQKHRSAAAIVTPPRLDVRRRRRPPHRGHPAAQRRRVRRRPLHRLPGSGGYGPLPRPRRRPLRRPGVVLRRPARRRRQFQETALDLEQDPVLPGRALHRRVPHVRRGRRIRKADVDQGAAGQSRRRESVSFFFPFPFFLFFRGCFLSSPLFLSHLHHHPPQKKKKKTFPRRSPASACPT